MDKTKIGKPLNSRLVNVIQQLIARFGLSDRLLITFAAAALLTVTIAAIGWLSFQQVVSTQRAITNDAIPAADAVQALARSNTQIIAIAPQFGRIESADEFTRIQGLLRDHVARMQALLGDLEDREFEPELRSRLADTVSSIEENINNQAKMVSHRLDLERRERGQIDEQRKAAQELVLLSESMVANASASTTAIISSLYSIIDRSAESSSEAYNALDRLIEVDVDNMERMSEFQLTCFHLKALIEQLDDAGRSRAISRIDSLFRTNLQLLERRINDIKDPQRREIARNLQHILAAAMTTDGLFDTHRERLALTGDIAQSQQLGNQYSSRLNEQATELLRAAAWAIDHASSEAEKAVDKGLVGFLVVAALLLLTLIATLWALMRHHIIGRLHGMEVAVRAISTGDLDVNISTAGDDELAKLGKALEHLRENARERERLEGELLDHQRNLEGQVNQRTAELQRSNRLLETEAAEHAIARNRAEEASQVKTTFLATMSHELRTPLSGVLGTLQLLGDTGLDKQQREYIRMIRVANTTLLEILEDMLGYSRLEAGKLDFEHAPFYLRETIDNILSLQALRAQSKDIALIREIDDQLPDGIVGDRRKLNQILLNLVGNAIKFTDEGSVTVTVNIDKEAVAGEMVLIFSVSDTGIGIPESKCDEVFAPFYQVSDTAHRRHGGTGLGLAICKKLVEAMGGEIALKSRLGDGTSIIFSLPYDLASQESSQQDEVASVSDAPSARPLTILVVEDDDINRMVCTQYLASLGHRSLEARDGVEALTLLQRGVDSIDVILMDISLPGASGSEVAIEIRALPDARWEQVPIIAMSAHVFGDTVESYYASGMVDFLGKPFSRDQLSLALRSATDTHEGDTAKTLIEGDTTTVAESKISPLLDRKYVEDELDTLGVSVFMELLDLFAEEASDALVTLNKLALEGDWATLSKRAHRLKSAAGNLGMSQVTGQAEKLERLASLPSANNDAVIPEINYLGEVCSKSVVELSDRLAQESEDQ